MASLNRTSLIGYVGQAPDIKYSEKDNANRARFSLATSENWTDRVSGEKRERTDWHNIVAFGKTAGVIERYVSKGSQLYVEGRLQTRDWLDDAGVKHWITEIVAQRVQLLDRKDSGRQPAPPLDEYDIGDLGPPLNMDQPAERG